MSARGVSVPDGFTRNPARAFWLTCDTCDEAELFYGADAAYQASYWAAEHRKECGK